MEDPAGEEAPAALLAAQLRSNDDDDAPTELRFDSDGGWFDDSWTAAERRDVLDAARENCTVHSVIVNVAGMCQDTAEGIACVVSRLALVDTIEIVGGADCVKARRAVDALLRGVTATRNASATPIRTLRVDAGCSPPVLLDFADRFTAISYIIIGGHCACNKYCPGYRCFVTSVAVAISQLKGLRGVRIHSNGSIGYIPALLHALNTSASVRSLDLILRHAELETWHDISLFSGFTASVEKVAVIASTSTMNNHLDISSLFELGLRRPFSPHLKELRFCMCQLDERITERNDAFDKAVIALQNVQFLGFNKCCMPKAFDLLGKLPNLKKFSSTSRSVYVRRDDTLEDEFDKKRYMLGTNAKVEELCEALEKLKALEEFVVDLVGQDESVSSIRADRSFPAISRLLRGSRGALVLNLGNFPWLTSEHIAWGMKGLSANLTELRIRCFRCDFADEDYATFLRPLESNVTLTTFELGFDSEADLTTPTAFITAVRDLVSVNHTLETLSLRGLDSDTASSLLEQIVPVLGFMNRSLQVLDLRDVDLTEPWPQLHLSLLVMLQENGVFKSLGTCQIPDDDPVATKFQYLLQLA